MNKIWLRREDESTKAFSAFKTYLETEDRTLKKVAEKCSKSITLMQRWSSAYEWRKRATAYDNAKFTEKYKGYLKRFDKFLENQFSTNEKLQARLMKTLTSKDMDKASWRSILDVWRSNYTEMIHFGDKLVLNNDAEDENADVNVTIKMV